MLDFLGEIECDGTVYISVPKDIIQNEIYERRLDFEKFNRKKQKRFILESFFNHLPVMQLLLFGKKTTFDKIQVTWSEEEENYVISFNFWDVLELHPRDEYSAMEELIWVFQMIQNEAIGSDKIILKKVKIDKEYRLILTKIINNQAYKMPFLSNKIEQKYAAYWLLMKLAWTGSRIGLDEFNFKSNWI